jgi:hypothetical protein
VRRTLAPLIGALLLSACSLPIFQPAATPDARVRPDQITVDPAQVEPGEVVGVSFPDEMTRGILFVLEQQTEEGWLPAYFLTSDGPGEGWEMTWSPPGGAGLAVEDIGVGGPGPDHVIIPEVAEPGTYLLCTANAADDVCTQIEIVAP